MKINIDTEKIKFKEVIPYLVIVGLVIFLLIDRCQGCQGRNTEAANEGENANPYSGNARIYTLAAGTQILNACAPSPRNARRMFTSVQTLPNNPNRLRINMYVTWEGATSCRYRINGVLTVDMDGCNPRFTRTSDNTSSSFCFFVPGCAGNIELPECLD